MKEITEIATTKALYAATIKDFMNNFGKNNMNEFARTLAERSPNLGFNARENEITSWSNNCEAINTLLTKAKLPNDVVIAFEYRAPVGGRVDCMLFGKSNGKSNIVLFELKAWERAELSYDGKLINTYTGNQNQDVEHPSGQAKRYHRNFTDYLKIFDDKENFCLTSIAYCFNYVPKEKDDALLDDNFKEIRKSHKLYTKNDIDSLAKLLSDLLKDGEGENVYREVKECPQAPTQKLIDAAASIYVGNDNFNLFGDQVVAYSKIESILDICIKDNKKSVIVVKGGPGTGKTLIALKLISAVAKQGLTPIFATRSTALRDQLREKIAKLEGKTKKDASNIVTSIYDIRPSNFVESQIDLLVVDEAHRIAENANSQNTGKYEVKVAHDDESNPYCPLNQALASMYCAKVCVFFIDDKQAVKKSEIGQSEKIINIAENYQEEIKKDIKKFKEFFEQESQKKIADKEKKEKKKREERHLMDEKEKENLDKEISKLERELKWIHCLNTINSTYKDEIQIEKAELKTQFRCSGGDKFVAWIDDVIYNKATDVKTILNKDDFEFKIFDDPNNLYNHIRKLNDPDNDITARLCAGWCWPWKDTADENGDLKKEVDLTPLGFRMPWETKKGIKGFKKEYRSNYAPDTNSWASHPMGINQIGCIHTAQGFEFDYVGVIIAPDLKYDKENDCLHSDYTVKNYDQGVPNSKKKKEKELNNELTKNIYRVLLTRGKKGCFVFCCDKGVADYFKRFIKE